MTKSISMRHGFHSELLNYQPVQVKPSSLGLKTYERVPVRKTEPDFHMIHMGYTVPWRIYDRCTVYYSGIY